MGRDIVELLREYAAGAGGERSLRDAPLLYAAADEIERLRADNERLRDRFTAPIVCICGSTRFKQTWIAENARLTSEGNIVLAVGLWGHHERVYPDDATKEKLDDLHKRKIDLCDWVWVLDVGGYLGGSTRSEIKYAETLGRPVRYLSREFPGYVEPLDETVATLRADNERLRQERDAAEARARRAAQRIIEEIGAPGPESVERTAERAAAEIEHLWAAIDDLGLRESIERAITRLVKHTLAGGD